MRHRKLSKRMGTDTDHAKANFRNLSIALIKYEKIKTTVAKAKQLRRFIEKIITLGKKGDLHSRRLAVSRLNNKEAVKKIFDDIAKRYINREGGYTRIVKAGYRKGDCAPMAYITFVEGDIKPKTETKEKATEDKKEVDKIKEKLKDEVEAKENIEENNEVSDTQKEVEKIDEADEAKEENKEEK